MSDLTDDTNHLLLIPPDFFMADLANVSSTVSDDIGSSVSKHAAVRTSLHARQHTMASYNHPNTADSSFHSHGAVGTNLPAQFHHSTPHKGAELFRARTTSGAAAAITMRSDDRNVIGEIDRFLSDNGRLVMPQPKSSPEQTRSRHGGDTTRARHSLFGGATNGSRTTDADTEPLLSLSAMWGNTAATTTITNNGGHTADPPAALHEERLRRTHCEHTIQQLQQTLLDRDQKLAVALRVDRRKDEALAAMRAEHSAADARSVHLQQQLDGAVQRFAEEHQLLEARCAKLQRDAERSVHELAQALAGRRHLLECNELLEQKVAHGAIAAAEVRAAQQLQLDELTVRLRNSEHTAEVAAEDYRRLVADADRQKAAAADAEKQSQQVQQSLRQQLDAQRVSLKAFYQQQLNEAVAGKLADFQRQVDDVERRLHADAQRRERLLAERAMRHMELLVQKNAEECALLGEKFAAEVELYRIRLAGAGQQMEGLRRQAEAACAKRSDMAVRLHGVMETQWQRAMEILAASPKAIAGTADVSSASSFEGSHRTQAESDDSCRTPTTARTTSTVVRKGVVGDGTGGDDAPNADRLQSYIELLLEKSPRDVDRMRDLLLAAPHTKHVVDESKAEQSRSATAANRSKEAWKK